MKLSIFPGKYVVAVSGGVDSMALLDMLCRKPGLELIVAHFDHGIREDSALDQKMVRQIAHKYNLPFMDGAAKLGPNASEAVARDARYNFLHKARKATGARAIITAHHQDDVLETAIFNLLRGTGRLGLSSLRSRSDIVRPLLHVPKQEILAYAQAHQLHWREDTTNQDQRYTRNYIRHTIMPRFTPRQRERLLQHITRARRLNDALDHALTNALHMQPAYSQLNRQWFISLPYAVSAEVMAAWLRARTIRNFDQKLIHQLVVAAKTLPAGKQRDINTSFVLRITKDMLYLTRRPLRKNSNGHV